MDNASLNSFATEVCGNSNPRPRYPPPIIQPCNQTQTPAPKGISSVTYGEAPNCNEAQENDLKSTHYSQVPAKENDAVPNNLPDDLRNVVAA